ncbi:sulfurtransferase complex subunit TusC [Aliiglaciecola sp. CAU 1673]|uniref:sulfurtransferase complex subunit TusC n=1 Tax=Aliiglaciecola sp. CAU 1673 TaxID=3032595 RepID=UPI0023DC6F53|nr:sulfurtransferase complex subunit TusC [Aliiglaciecola sp. CAU 1673]MDF2177608.1 sulfurtransferase complex subunit TusC [Aliiglaciecola sp. CAU 1673]
MSAQFGLLFRSAPHGNANGQEALDLALVAGTFGQDVALFFLDDGVFQLMKDQHPEHIGRKNYSRTFAALEFYDINQIYVCQVSLNERGLHSADLCIEAEVLTSEQWQEKVADCQHILSF